MYFFSCCIFLLYFMYCFSRNIYYSQGGFPLFPPSTLSVIFVADNSITLPVFLEIFLFSRFLHTASVYPILSRPVLGPGAILSVVTEN